jgi:uncharacterized protein YecE (DUF72 family)
MRRIPDNARRDERVADDPLVRARAARHRDPVPMSASFRAEPENVANMRKFFAAVERPNGIRFLWEPRGPWPDSVIAEICRDLDLTHVVDPFDRDAIPQALTYWRLHGVGNHYHVYTEDELRALIAKLPRGGDAYVMFNNIPRVRDAERFIALLRAGVS